MNTEITYVEILSISLRNGHGVAVGLVGLVVVVAAALVIVVVGCTPFVCRDLTVSLKAFDVLIDCL